MAIDVNSDITLLLPLVGTTQAALKRLEKGTGSLSFTRATTATRLNPDTNLIESVASGDLREDGRNYYNRLLYSEDFTKSAWGKLDSSVLPDETVAPNRKTVASKLSEAATNNYHQAYQTTVTQGQIIFSVFLKAGERSWVKLCQAGDAGAFFNLSTGTVGSITSSFDAGIVSYSDGWYRCWIKPPASVTYCDCAVKISTDGSTLSYSGDVTKGIYMWGAQLEDGSAATRYRKSGANPAYAPKGVLIEGQRTNLLTYSEQFDNAAWSNLGSGSVSANAVASPDGNTTADGMVEAAVTDYFGRYQSFSATSGEKYAFSCYVAAGLRGWAYLREGINGDMAYFDLVSGVAGTVDARFSNAKIEYIGNGWWRLEVIYTSNGTGTRRFDVGVATADNTPSYLGTAATIGAYFWGAQVEQASFPSSYIPTTSAAVTRNEDALTLASSGNIDGTVGSLVAEFEVGMNSAGTIPQYLQSIVGGSNMFMYIQGTTYDTVLVFDGTTAATPSGSAISVKNKAATRWGAGAIGSCVNGGAVGAGGFDGDMQAAGSITFGGGYAGFGPNRLHLKYVIVLNRRLTDAEMIAVTS